MFSEPIINSVNNLFNVPGLGLDLAGAGVLACGVLCYMARVAWTALAQARRMEMEGIPAVELPSNDLTYDGPYCAG